MSNNIVIPNSSETINTFSIYDLERPETSLLTISTQIKEILDNQIRPNFNQFFNPEDKKIFRQEKRFQVKPSYLEREFKLKPNLETALKLCISKIILKMSKKKEIKAVIDDLMESQASWEKLKGKIIQAVNEGYYLNFIHWITGNNSSGLIGMRRYGNLANHAPSLVPTGILLEKKIEPLCGELMMGLRGVNRKCLSGVLFSKFEIAHSYAKAFRFSLEKEIEAVFDYPKKSFFPPQRLKIAALRLANFSKKDQLVEDMIKHLKEVKNTFSDNLSRLKKNVFLIGQHINLQLSQLKERLPIEKVLQIGDLVGVKFDDGTLEYAVCLEHTDKTSKALILNSRKHLPIYYDLSDLYLVDSSYSELTHSNFDHSNLSFGLSSSHSEEFAQQILGFSDEANGQRPFAKTKSTRDASKIAEDKGEKPKTQVSKIPPQIEDLINDLERNLEGVEEAVAILEKGATYSLSEEEEAFVDKPFPIVWGSTHRLNFLPVKSAIREERALEGILEVGKQINVVFTKKRDKAKLIEWLNKEKIDNVTHLSFTTATILSCLQPFLTSEGRSIAPPVKIDPAPSAKRVEL